jgi:hypothetical protein
MVRGKNPTYTQLSPEVKQEIKTKYMEGFSTSHLASEYSLVRQSLGHYVKKHQWKEQRALQRAELFAQFSDTKKAAFTGIYMNGVQLLQTAIQDAMKEYEAKDLDIKDKLKLAKSISEVIKELDKIVRLDEGQPTEIREDRPFSIEEVKIKLNKDPFYQEITDADFKEIDS